MNSLCTPLDLEIREFADYDVIIDARSPREFAEDHIPSAVNHPVVNNEEYAQVGTLHRHDTHKAYVIGVTHSLRNMATAIEQIAQRCGPQSRFLVYCFRGGKRSKLWADNLRTIGYQVDVLRGGWKNYRRWVIASLETLPRGLDFKVICGPTGCGKSRLLKAIERQGGQVLDLERLANHRGSLLGAIPSSPQPSQKWFDSMLLEQLRTFDPALPVFVESESKKIGNVQLPESLMGAMAQATILRINAPMPLRVQIWTEDFAHFVRDPEMLISRIEHLAPLLGNKTLAEWKTLAQQGKVLQVFEELMLKHYDPAYAKSNLRLFHGLSDQPERMIDAIDADAMDQIASRLLSDQQVIE